MNRRGRVVWVRCWGLCALLATACTEAATPADGGVPDAAPTPAIARFTPSDGTSPMSFGDVPFPHDLYLDDTGHVSLADLPLQTMPSPGLTALLERTRLETGFCVTCGMHFYVDGDLDAASVPATLPASPTAAVVLADVDPTSPERGTLFPLELQWRARAGLLSVRPSLGITLHRNRRYAVAVTSQLRGADGGPLAATAAFAAARDGTASTDPAIVRARAVLEPALAELATAGVDVAQVVSCAVFTTGDPLAAALSVRDAVRAADAPVASVDVVYPTATVSLDELMGVPATTGFGLELPEAGGVAGERGLPHTSTSRVVVGSLTSPRVVEGTGAELGRLHRDATGRPASTGVEDIPFVLVIPTGADVTSLPVVIVAHGSPRTMEDALGLADTLGVAGIAVLGYDAFQHGGRSLGAVDELTARFAAGSDGFFEHDRTSVQLRVFAVEGAPDGFSASPLYQEGTFTQAFADALGVVRFAVEGDLSVIAAADPSLAGIAFDPDAIFFLGNSYGTSAGGLLLSTEPDLDAAVLNVPSGSLTQTIAGAARSQLLVTSGILPFYGIRGPFDETTRRVLFEPMLDVVGWIFAPVDPHALAPYVYLDPGVPGPRPDLLTQHAELDDYLPIWGAQSMVASLGIERLGPFDFVGGVAEASRPVSGNVTTATGNVTAVAHLYEGAAHGMLAWHEVEVAFEAPIIPPLVPLDPPRVVTNPTDELHLEIRAFFSSHVTMGRAQLP